MSIPIWSQKIFGRPCVMRPGLPKTSSTSPWGFLVVEGRLQLTPMPGSPVRVRGNRIRLEDGREMVIRLEAVP